ncbi:MAG: hypothetical protein FWC73_01475 [Defluviitaleaceae bacterium]|nr:hypothetical protein [Defluviitaleaceae bacterium]
MKEYKEYMNRISGGAAMGNKILNRIAEHTQKGVKREASDIYNPGEYDEYRDSFVQDPYDFDRDIVTRKSPRATRRKRALVASLTLSACAAGVVAALVFLPGLLNRPAVILPEDVVGFYVDEPEDVPVPNYVAPPMQQDGELIFNFREIVGYSWLETSWNLWYTLPLTDEMFAAAFPGFNIILDWVGAGYDEDGNLVNIMAQEIPATWQLHYRPVNVRTNITISRWEMPRHLIYQVAEDSPEPQMSYIGGVPVMVIVYEGQGPVPQVDYSPPFPTVEIWAHFEMDGVHYSVQVVDDRESGMAHITTMINALIASGPADLSVLDAVIMPVWGDFPIATIEEAREDPIFGAYVPLCPEGFELAWGTRTFTSHENDMRIQWRLAGFPFIEDYIQVWIRKAADVHGLIVVDVNDRSLFDWSYYPVFIDHEWLDSLEGTPARQTILNPVFRIEDLTEDIIRSRAYWYSPEVEFPWHIGSFAFSILDGDTLIYMSHQLSIYEGRDRAALLWEMLRPRD